MGFYDSKFKLGTFLPLLSNKFVLEALSSPSEYEFEPPIYKPALSFLVLVLSIINDYPINLVLIIMQPCLSIHLSKDTVFLCILTKSLVLILN